MTSALVLVDVIAFGVTVAAVVRRHMHSRAMLAAAPSMAEKAPPVKALFIDCDDCLYQNDWATAKKITTSIAAYTNKLGVSKEEAYALYQKHGTCLKGLLVEGRIDPGAGVEEFLREVHTIDYSDIHPDPPLRAELANLTVPHWVFTASTSEHANRCLDRLGLSGLPWRGIIDTRSCELETKHSRSSFEAAMRIAGVPEEQARACVFCDDSVKNIKVSRFQPATSPGSGSCRLHAGSNEGWSSHCTAAPAALQPPLLSCLLTLARSNLAGRKGGRLADGAHRAVLPRHGRADRVRRGRLPPRLPPRPAPGAARALRPLRPARAHRPRRSLRG